MNKYLGPIKDVLDCSRFCDKRYLGELQWAAFNAENLNRRYHLATTKIFENQVQGAPS